MTFPKKRNVDQGSASNKGSRNKWTYFLANFGDSLDHYFGFTFRTAWCVLNDRRFAILENQFLLSLCDSCSWVPEVFRPVNLNFNFLITVYKISTGLKGGICDLFIPVWQAGSDFLIAVWRNVLHFVAFSYANLGPEYINVRRLITRLSLHIYTKSSEEIEEVVGGQAGSGGDCHRSESLISQVSQVGSQRDERWNKLLN